MPFEKSRSASKRIAVIGGGISGLGAAHYLADRHNVVLFEAEPRLGGHARTRIAGKNGDQWVDTGFIVFNYATYPHLTRLFEDLDVPVAPSDMSFGVSVGGGSMEYALRNRFSVLAQKRNAARPAFWGMIRDILKFNREAPGLARDTSMTIGQLVDRLGLGDWFREYYILPFSGAIWSTPTRDILDFPAEAMLRFFKNHGLLSPAENHRWFTVDGGSVQYVNRLENSLFRRGVDLRVGARVRGVRRTPIGVDVRTESGEWDSFDEVVFATHSDVTLGLLSDATGVERTALSAVRYQANEAILHADPVVMPKRKRAWASWVYAEGPGTRPDRIGVSYWMNSLQPIPKDDPMFVTLNSTHPIRDELIYDTHTFMHPVYDLAALAAQDTIRAINGQNRTWFCGAWMRNGFHEDGIATAWNVAEAILAEDAQIAMAAQ